MSDGPVLPPHRATVWLIVKGLALIATGYLAAVGMTFVCLVSRYLDPAWHDIGFVQEMPEALYAAFFAVTVLWVVIAGRFAWHNRTWPGLTLSAIAFVAFAYSAWNVLRFAYPVCNAF